MSEQSYSLGPMLNSYPDSMGGTLKDITAFLEKEELRDVFDAYYILPSIFNSDLDRGFSIIDYSLNKLYASREDLSALEKLHIHLKLDFVLNHASVLSRQFQDILKNGKDSEYKDFFIDWNKFWDGCGEMTEEGYIKPDEKYLKDMFFRKPGLPILMVRMPDGSEVPYWNTFYQEVRYEKVDAQDLLSVTDNQYGIAEKIAGIVNSGIDDGKKPAELEFGTLESYKEPVISLLEEKRKYLGQMDLNIKSPLVWDYYDDTLRTLSEYGAKIVRLDAFAYAPKEPGEKNFLNDPGTWELLEKVREIAEKYDLMLLPEIHASYQEKIYELVASKGYMVYDFFLPGLLIDALERGTGELLTSWFREIQEKGIKTVNMLGCHDGIPMLDLKGLLPDEKIQEIIDLIVARGGFIKNLHGQKNMYYQVNATYYSALGEDDKKMLLARAIQLFMPGKPQIWYLDLFAGKNDHEAVKRAGVGGHKEINRTNLTTGQMEEALQTELMKKQLELLHFRNQFPAFSEQASIKIENDVKNRLMITWENGDYYAKMEADLSEFTLHVLGENRKNSEIIFEMRD